MAAAEYDDTLDDHLAAAAEDEAAGPASDDVAEARSWFEYNVVMHHDPTVRL
jgi:hypothetical protein